MAEIKAFKSKPELIECCQRLEKAIKDIQSQLGDGYLEIQHTVPVSSEDKEYLQECVQIWGHSHILIKLYLEAYGSPP